ncbi:MAG: GTPase HflX [Legionellales bacterium]|nr:GTPase HflX [Legionellales bacterium]|tara:strand:+ start:1713 stop:2966 length:1254 start_codon:yes stop_codon:yes gene_type:complete
MGFIQPSIESPSVIILYITLKGLDQGNDLDEMEGLAKAGSCSVVSVYKVHLSKINSKYFVGKGHLDCLKQQCSQFNLKHILVNQDLSASVQKNLSEYLCADIIDRTELILHIFSLHARSFAGQLQVELAQLTRLSTRLIRGWTHLERQKGGIGLRGPGETQLETDRRLIARRIKTIRKKLKMLHAQQKETSKRRGRSSVPTVALLGYTNSGKSTLFNALTASSVLCAGYPFATLDPITRWMSLPGHEGALLMDTVGFIKGLPPSIIEAFHATLDAIYEADVLIHVMDIQKVNQEGYRSSSKDVFAVLNELGDIHQPIITVYNKLDLTDQPGPKIGDLTVNVSALNLIGLDDLKASIVAILSEAYPSIEVCMLFEKAQLRALCHQQGWVQKEVLKESHWLMQLKAPKEALIKYFPDHM